MYFSSVICAVVYSVIGILAYTLNNRIAYIERIHVDAFPEDVFENIAKQETLMEWSAWPEATGSTCHVHGHDGQVGAKLIFTKNDKEFGHQRITKIIPGKSVTLELYDSGPLKHDARLTLSVQPSDKGSEVTLDFENTFVRPFHLPARAFGITDWVRALQLRDLQGLKEYSERISR